MQILFLNQMSGRSGVAGDVTVTSRQGCKGSPAGEWSTGSSGEEDTKAQSLKAENNKLRARIDGLGKKEGVQEGPSFTSTEGGHSEDVWGRVNGSRR